MEPAAAPAPGLDDRSSSSPLPRPQRPQEWQRHFPIKPVTVQRARTYACTRLTMTSWPGDQEDATRIVVELVKNVIDHVGPQHGEGELVLDLAVAEDETLRIAVTDPSPQFPDFLKAVSAQKSTGVPLIRELGGETTWRPAADEHNRELCAGLRPPSDRSCIPQRT